VGIIEEGDRSIPRPTWGAVSWNENSCGHAGGYALGVPLFFFLLARFFAAKQSVLTVVMSTVFPTINCVFCGPNDTQPIR
jgi:hypothetical protein